MTLTNMGNDRRFNAPGEAFGGGGSRQLSLKLFYDVTEPIEGRVIDDVRIETNKLAELTRIDRDLDRPPVVQVTWGQAPIGSDFPFTGVITSLTQTFVLFTSEGKPVRANVDVTFTEFLKPELDQRETDPEMTTYRIKRGDSLASIAAAMYGDPSQWRIIAEANNLDDPRALEIGRTLSIPELM
jgi:nucleoid-associated protein YgaU